MRRPGGKLRTSHLGRFNSDSCGRGGSNDSWGSTEGVWVWEGTDGGHLGDGDAVLGNLLGDVVGGGLDDGCSVVVGDADGDGAGADGGGLHGVSVGLVGGVGEVAAQPVALDDGRVVGWGAIGNGARDHQAAVGTGHQGGEDEHGLHGG